METWKYFLIIAICLCVSLYMFLSLFYPPLRWLFRMKRLPARALGVGEEQNERFANVLCFLIAPVAGLMSLLVAFSAFNGWKSDRERQSNRLVAEGEARRELREKLGAALSSWEVRRVYRFDRRQRQQADAAGVAQARDFVRNLEPHLGDGLVPEIPIPFEPSAQMLAIELKSDPSDLPTTSELTLLLDPEDGKLALRRPDRSRGEELMVPPDMREAAKILGDMTIIDLDELERIEREERMAENRRKQERVRVLNSYSGKTTMGKPAWQIRDELEAARGQTGEQELIDGLVGMEVEWEILLRQIRGNEAQPDEAEALGYQRGENARRGYYISLVMPNENRPSPDELGEVWWVRARGKIRSINRENGTITVETGALQPFVPEI